MPGFDVDRSGLSVLFANNVDFTGASATSGTPQVLLDGQLLIGNAISPHIRVGNITSLGGTIAVTYAAPNINLDITGGQVAVEHLTGDTGGQLNPDGANNFNLLGQQAGTIAVMDTIGVGSTIRFEDRTWTTSFVVDPAATVGLRGTFQTITAALTAASSGTDIFIRPGTYTENLTMKAGVNIVGYKGDGNTPQVTIIGTVGAAYSGTATISNVRLQTNSANFLSLTGANATIIYLFNCFLNATNADGIGSTGSNSAATVFLFNCLGDVGTTGIKQFAFTNGTFSTEYCRWNNSGGSVTASTQSGGGVSLRYTTLSLGFATSGSTATIGIRHCVIDTVDFPSVAITHNSTSAATCQIYDSFIGSGSSSAVSVGAGAQTQFYDNIVASSNTNAITGAGSIADANTIFAGTSLTNNVTTLTKKASSGISFNTTDSLATYTVGTFAPDLQFGGSNSGITYTQQLGNYVKIGKVVYVNIYIVLSSKGVQTGTATISNLPFASLTQSGLIQTIPSSVRAALTVTNFAGMNGQIASNASVMTLSAWTTAGANVVLQDTMFANTTAWIMNGFYIAGA